MFFKKGGYPYKYMDRWGKFDETSLPDKKAFYCELYLEDIVDKDVYTIKNYLKNSN